MIQASSLGAPLFWGGRGKALERPLTPVAALSYKGKTLPSLFNAMLRYEGNIDVFKWEFT